MMIGAEVGDHSNVGILIDDLGLVGSRLVSDVVDAIGFIGFAIGINHGSSFSGRRNTPFADVPS